MTDFWRNVATGDDCWEWTGTRRPDGYGVWWNGGRQVRAHRAAWELERGPIPRGLSVLHSCDNPPCVRPDHLRLGSQRENMADMDARGRRRSSFGGRDQSGEHNDAAKLTAAQVAVIRGMADAGHYHDDIAARFGINKTNVSYIARRKTWVGVEPVPHPPAVRDRPVGRPPRRGLP